MQIYEYRSYDDYQDTQVETTVQKVGGGRTLNRHNENIARLLRVALDLRHPVGPGARVLCMGVRRGVEIAVWELKGYRNVAGVELAPLRAHPKVFSADFASLGDHVGAGSIDVIYANHSFEHSYDPAKTAREWRRVLKPDGLLWIGLPTSLGAGLDAPSRTDPVLITGVADLEELFAPLRAVWAEAEVGGTPAGATRPVINLNAVLAPESAVAEGIDADVASFMRRAIRRGRTTTRGIDLADRVGWKFLGRRVVSDRAEAVTRVLRRS